MDPSNARDIRVARPRPAAIAAVMSLFVLAGGLCFVLLSTTERVHSAAPLAPGEKPNIILIIGDDAGFPHYGFMGHPRIETPAMDTLVGTGVLFPVAYNSGGMCIPSLETILTGRYQ